MTTTPLAPTPTVTAVRTLAIVGLCLGIASIVFGFNPAFGVAGLVLGILALRREPAGRSFAIAAIVTGSVSLVGIVAALFGALLLVPFIPLLATGLFW